MFLITGANGLLGRELVREILARGGNVRALDRTFSQPVAASTTPSVTNETTARRAAEWCFADLRDAAACAGACAGIETVIHCAALQYHSAPPRWGQSQFFAANAAMTRNVAQAAAHAGVRRLIFVSTDMVYGLPPGRALCETDIANPIGPYGRSKLAAEREWLAVQAAGRNVAILRPRLIVGPGRLGVLEKLFARIATGKAVPVIGDGHNRYQMVGVADVADACLRAAERDATGIFNLGSANPPTVNALLGELIRRAGSGARLLHIPAAPARAALWSLAAIGASPLTPEQFRIADVDYTLDTRRAQRELGWSPRHSDVDMLWAAYVSWRDGRAAATRRQTADGARELADLRT